MDPESIENALREEIAKDDHKDPEPGLFFPSEITGCPLKVFLERMLRMKVHTNSYLFQGSAVHFYLQQSGILDEALHNAGYHLLDTNYELSTEKQITDDVRIHGSCDILCENENSTAIFDVKYSSLIAGSGNGRILKYYSQANTYAYLFDADEYGLIMIHSSSGDSDDFFNRLSVLQGNKSEENWEITKNKATALHEALIDAGYDQDEVWEFEMVQQQDKDFWRDLVNRFGREQMPAYEGECKYCDFKDFCPVYNNTVGSGVGSLIDR